AGAAATARAAVATPAAIEADVALPAVSTGAAGTAFAAGPAGSDGQPLGRGLLEVAVARRAARP
ncbi:hypothetical protein, partial [Mycobacterium tuberculosis]